MNKVYVYVYELNDEDGFTYIDVFDTKESARKHLREDLEQFKEDNPDWIVYLDAPDKATIKSWDYVGYCDLSIQEKKILK